MLLNVGIFPGEYPKEKRLRDKFPKEKGYVLKVDEQREIDAAHGLRRSRRTRARLPRHTTPYLDILLPTRASNKGYPFSLSILSISPFSLSVDSICIFEFYFSI